MCILVESREIGSRTWPVTVWINDKGLQRNVKYSYYSLGWTCLFLITNWLQSIIQFIRGEGSKFWGLVKCGSSRKQMEQDHFWPGGTSGVRYLGLGSVSLWWPLGVYILWAFQLMLMSAFKIAGLHNSRKAWKTLRMSYAAGTQPGNYFWNPESLCPFLAQAPNSFQTS